ALLLAPESRRIRILGATAHPTASLVMLVAKNLVWNFQDVGCRARFLIRDRDGKYPQLFDAVFRDAGIEEVLSGVRMPRNEFDNGAVGAGSTSRNSSAAPSSSRPRPPACFAVTNRT